MAGPSRLLHFGQSSLIWAYLNVLCVKADLAFNGEFLHYEPLCHERNERIRMKSLKNAFQRSEIKARSGLWSVWVIVSLIVGCKGPPPSPNANLVDLQVTAAADKTCSADTGGHVIVTGSPFAGISDLDRTCAVGAPDPSLAAKSGDPGPILPSTRTFQVPIGSTVTFTATPETPTDKFATYDGAIHGSGPVATLLVTGSTNVTAIFCGLIK